MAALSNSSAQLSSTARLIWSLATLEFLQELATQRSLSNDNVSEPDTDILAVALTVRLS
jgi:hypothetical protein